MRERPRAAAEWIDPDRMRRAPDLRKVESERRVARSVAISSGSKDGEDSDWNRVAYLRRSVLSESDEGARAQSRRACEAASAGEQTLRAVKLLKDWGLKFSGEEREDPEEFLERIEECRKGAAVGDEGLLNALPCVLTKGAARWFRTMRLEPPSWAGFRKAFRHQFVTEYDREDLLDDLRRRTQAKGEKIATYLANLNYIVSRGDARRPGEVRASLGETEGAGHPLYSASSSREDVSAGCSLPGHRGPTQGRSGGREGSRERGCLPEAHEVEGEEGSEVDERKWMCLFPIE